MQDTGTGSFNCATVGWLTARLKADLPPDMNVKRKQTFLISAFLAICGTIGAQETPAALRLTPKRLTNITDSYPMLSPDGSKIVFESNRSGSAEIYVINTGGESQVQVTMNKVCKTIPGLCAQGTRNLFSF